MSLTPTEIQAIAAEVVEQLRPVLSVQEQSELTTAEVAELLRVSIPTVERLVNRQEIPSYLIGRCRRYSREAVLNAVRSQESQR